MRLNVRYRLSLIHVEGVRGLRRQIKRDIQARRKKYQFA